MGDRATDRARWVFPPAGASHPRACEVPAGRVPTCWGVGRIKHHIMRLAVGASIAAAALLAVISPACCWTIWAILIAEPT
jgi:hypothetical protein